METGIKPRTERGKAFYRSASESQVEDAFTIPVMNRSPGLPSGNTYPGSFSSVDISELLSKALVMATKTYMSDLQREVQPLKDKLNEIVNEIQKIRVSMHQFEHEKVRAEHDTSAVERSTNEPQGLTQNNIEEEQPYQDSSKLRPGLLKSQSIDNQLYGYIGRNNEGSIDRNETERKEEYGQQSSNDSRTESMTTPKEFRSYSLQIKGKPSEVDLRRRSAIEINKASFDERECLAYAMQFHIEDLVDGVVFCESELPDCLLAEGCLTEDECSTVRHIRDRKDQIRVLLSLIKGRDLRVLKGFMKYISEHNRDVAQKINTKFEDNKRSGLKGKLCALCNLKKQYNVKHVADGLWAIQAIEDELYNRIIYSENPVGAQSSLWQDVFQSLNGLDRQKAELAQNKFIQALSNKNLFLHLADCVKNMLIRNHGKLTCACEPRLILPRRTPSFGGVTSAESFLPDSSSDGTSNDLGSFDWTESGDKQERAQVSDAMSRIAETEEIPSSPSSILPDKVCIGSECQQEDNSSLTLPKNSSPTSSPSSLSDNVHSVQPKFSTHSKNPVPPVKPPVPSKKPDIKLNVLKKPTAALQGESPVNKSPLSTNTPTNTCVQKTEHCLGHEEENVPPLPEKKNKHVQNII